MADLSRANFRQRVTFKVPSKTPDVQGGNAEAYTALLSTWAVVQSKTGRKIFDNGIEYVVEDKDIYVTWRSALSVVDKDGLISYGGRDFKIICKNFVGEEKHLVKYETQAI